MVLIYGQHRIRGATSVWYVRKRVNNHMNQQIQKTAESEKRDRVPTVDGQGGPEQVWTVRTLMSSREFEVKEPSTMG